MWTVVRVYSDAMRIKIGRQYGEGIATYQECEIRRRDCVNGSFALCAGLLYSWLCCNVFDSSVLRSLGSDQSVCIFRETFV